eukprot:364393-Chlamydomonas_euryale.AAC.5
MGPAQRRDGGKERTSRGNVMVATGCRAPPFWCKQVQTGGRKQVVANRCKQVVANRCKQVQTGGAAAVANTYKFCKLSKMTNPATKEAGAAGFGGGWLVAAPCLLSAHPIRSAPCNSDSTYGLMDLCSTYGLMEAEGHGPVHIPPQRLMEAEGHGPVHIPPQRPDRRLRRAGLVLHCKPRFCLLWGCERYNLGASGTTWTLAATAGPGQQYV